MCGIIALWGELALVPTLLEQAVDALGHRGPDGRGTYVSPSERIGLGHTRLAIQDLSDNGRQPIASPSGSLVGVYNGEIYNHLAWRNELEERGVRFRGHSDSETLMAAVEEWGVEETVRRANGMFAFAIWDASRQAMLVGRDRVGIKPLYVGTIGRTLVLTSELGPLSVLGVPPIDETARASFFRFGCVPDDLCIFQGFRKVPPGTTAVLDSPTSTPDWVRYWSVPKSSEPQSFTTAVESVETTLDDAVRARLLSDVPVGVFLSGGIDSSLVAATMRRFGRVRSFSMAFDEGRYDERNHARAVAAALDLDHHEEVVVPRQALDLIPQLGTVYTEPFADSSQIPTLLVCQLARRHVTVVLTGDGGDEVFGGYNRHFWAPRVWQARRRLPGAAARFLAGGLNGIAASTRIEAILSNYIRLPREKLRKLARVLRAESPTEMLETLESIWQVAPVANAAVRVPRAWDGTPLELMNADLLGYLHHDILVKLDRASMSVGLEGRVPFLDHSVVAAARAVPIEHHFRGRKTKALLRELLRRRVPEVNFDRPKMGFGVPIEFWLRAELRDWAESLLRKDRIESAGLLPDAVRQTWRAHLSGEPRQHELWAVLMYISWLEGWTCSRP